MVAEELIGRVAEVLRSTGFTASEQREVFERLQKARRKPVRAAKQLLERTHAIADLLSFWQRSERFVDTEGVPRVLPIRGKGSTLESLARRFVPDMSRKELIAAITRRGEVKRVKGNKVMLAGTTMLLLPSTPELTLATITLAAGRLFGTILHNLSLPEDRRQEGYFQRYVTGEFTEKEFAVWQKRFRDKLQQYLEGAEASLRLSDSKRHRGKSGGVSLFMFRDE